MASAYDKTQPQYHFRTASVPVTGEPFTMATWFYATDATTRHSLMELWRTDIYAHYLQARGDVAGDPVRCQTYGDPDGYGSADTSSGYSVNTWHHAAGVWASDTSRAGYIDGGSKGTNVEDCDAGAVTRMNLAAHYVGSATAAFCLGGRLAEPAIWNVALSDAEIAQLAVGVCPLLIRPDALVSYWPVGGLYGEHALDTVGGFDLTPTVNAPTWAEHPSGLMYPNRQIFIPPASAAPPASDIPWYYYAQQEVA